MCTGQPVSLVEAGIFSKPDYMVRGLLVITFLKQKFISTKDISPSNYMSLINHLPLLKMFLQQA